MISIKEQFFILLYSFLSGIVFGGFFDLYKAFVFETKNIFINGILSILFWILVGLGVFVFLLYTQYAILSLYTYFYIFLGVMFYLNCISLIFKSINKIFIEKFIKILKKT